MIEAEAEIDRDLETVHELAKDLTVRYTEGLCSVEGDAAECNRAAGAQAGRDPFPAPASRELGPSQARGRLLRTLFTRPDRGT